MTARNNVPILPDSTGRQIYLKHFLEIIYNNASGNTFSVNDTVTGQTSQTVGIVSRVDEIDLNNGRILVVLNDSNPLGDYTVGENLQVNLATIAQVASVENVYISPTNIVSWDNPDFGQRVDNQGSAFVRFSEGPPQLDAFGRLQVSDPHYLGKYLHTYDILPNLFETTIVGSGTAFHDPNQGSVVLEVDSVSGSLVSRASHKYHPYQPGASQNVAMTVFAGDSGKDNVYRRWGYYDLKDGLYFQISGSEFQVVKRSSTNNGMIEEEIVDQSDFNVDRVDGTKTANNLSQVNLDFSNNNIYWIDYQWLGAGSARMGINVDGSRITLHEFKNANRLKRPYMRTGALPIRYEMFNSGTSSGTSQMKFNCASVITEADFEPFTQTSFGVSLPNEAAPGNLYNKVAFNNLPGRNILSLRNSSTFKGQENRVLGVPRTLSLTVSSGSAVAISIYKSCNLTSASWAPLSDDSAFEIDFVGEIDPDNLGKPVGHRNLVSPGSENINLLNIFGIEKEHLSLSANGEQNVNCFTFVAHNISNVFSSTDLTASFSTGEITRTSGDFTSDGFESGHGVFVSGSNNNDGYYTIDSISALTMSLGAFNTPTSEIGTTGVRIDGGALSLVHAAVNVEEYQ